MSNADEKSKQYRDYREQCGIKDPVMLDEIEEAYYEGYHQAEKDLELTCGDIETILNAFLDFKIESFKSRKTKRYTDEEYCQEVLKRFKERKEK